MCRSCGAIIGAGESACAVCGAAAGTISNAPSDSRTPDRETLRFARAVLNRPYLFTIILLVTNLFIFLLMWQSSGMKFESLWSFDATVLVAYGAKLNFLISAQHEWWRFVTPMFLHAGLPHLLVNMYSLWMIGPYVEKLYGAPKFVVMWVVTGIAGVVASYLTVRPALASGSLGRFLFKLADEPSVGASGALFGLVGVLFVFGIKYRRELPEGFKRAFGTGLLPVIMINLFIGYLGRGFIDNAAHLGGLVSGAALAVAVDYRRPNERSGIALIWRLLQVASLALGGLSFVQVWEHFRSYEPPPAVEDPARVNFLAFLTAVHEAQDLFKAKPTDAARLDAVISTLEKTTAPDRKAADLTQRLLLLLRRARENLQVSQSQRQKDLAPEKQLSADFDAWEKDYNAWVKDHQITIDSGGDNQKQN